MGQTHTSFNTGQVTGSIQLTTQSISETNALMLVIVYVTSMY